MGPDAAFQIFLTEGRFMIQRGVDSKAAVFPPRMFAPGAGEALEWFKASGRGTVYSVTVIRKRPPEPSDNVALIELEEGPRMMSRVEGIAPEDAFIGMRVAARIVGEPDERHIAFVPAT